MEPKSHIVKGKHASIINLAINFLQDHWDEIDLKKTDITESKEIFIKKVRRKYSDISWIVTDVMNWGCKKNYSKQYRVDCESDHFVYKVEDKYFMFNPKTRTLEPAQPKIKNVLYF